MKRSDNTPRAELESLIWHNLPALSSGPPETRVQAMDAILAAIDGYTQGIASAAVTAAASRAAEAILGPLRLAEATAEKYRRAS